MLKMEYPDKLKDPKIKELLGKLDTSEDVLKFNDRLFKPSKESQRNNQKLKRTTKKRCLNFLSIKRSMAILPVICLKNIR